MLVQIKCMIYLFIVIVQISLLTPQRKRYMGQGGGCLGPVKNKDQIYVKLITEMHAQAQKITNTQNLDLYTAIKQKITKKGYLRKFIDNLSCHRQKILDSLNFNFKSTTQKKQIERHYAGLIIADAIIEMVYSPTTFSEISAKDDMSEYDENNMSFFKKNAFKMKQISSDVPEYKLEMLEQYKIVYDEQYFKLITFLFDIQKKMYARLLDSLIAFCTRHTGQINCESYVWKTIEKMNNNIKKRTFLAQSCQLFYLLLIRTKDQLTQQLRNQQNLISIIKTWLKQRQNEEQEGIQIQDYCKQIIQTYFHRCLSSWDSLFIYESIFSIYDSIQFQVIQRQPLEKMYEQILKHSDFEKNFYRGLFNYFLGYMSITNQNYVDELDRKWFSTTLGLSYQKIRSNYKSLLKEKVKIQCFKLLPKWIQKHYVDINEYCMYNSKALIFVYLENSKHFNRNKGSTIMIMDEYFKVIKKMQLGYRRLFMQRLFQQIREQGLTSIQYQLLLKLIQQMVYNNILTENPPINEADQSPDGNNSIKLEAISEQQQLDLYLTPILPKYSQQVKLELIKLLGYVAQSSKEFRLNEEGRVKLCQFLYSIYDNIVYGNSRKMNPKVRNKESFAQNNDKNKVNRSSGNNGLSINSEQLYTKYEFICSVISLFRIFIVQQEILSSEQRMKTSSQQAPQKLQNQQTQLIPTSSSNTNQNHSQHEQESRQKESQAKQYTNIQNVLKIYVQKIQEQMQTLSQKYSRILEPDIQIKQSREESNFNISSNSFKFSAEIEYLLIYLLEQIKAMLTPSNKQIQTEKYTKNEVLVKMTAINNKLKPTINREEHLEQIMREIKDFLEQYRQKDNLFIIVEKEIEQQEQFRSILGRYFSISNPITDPYKQFLSRPTLAQKLSRTDSDNMSTYTKQSSKYGGLVNQNARCQKCKNLPQKCVDCRDKDRRSFRHSDYSFMEVIDIVKV